MQRREQPKRRLRRRGLAVPIALLALIIIGILVTGAFYVLSRAPEPATTGAVPTGQSTRWKPQAAPTPADTIDADSMEDDSVDAASVVLPFYPAIGVVLGSELQPVPALRSGPVDPAGAR